MLVFDLDPRIVSRADRRAPERSSLRVALGLLGDRPRSRQCAVVHRDLVIEDVLVGLVEKNTLLDDGVAVLVKRQAARIVNAVAYPA
jgi:hypothetical protein